MLGQRSAHGPGSALGWPERSPQGQGSFAAFCVPVPHELRFSPQPFPLRPASPSDQLSQNCTKIVQKRAVSKRAVSYPLAALTWLPGGPKMAAQFLLIEVRRPSFHADVSEARRTGNGAGSHQEGDFVLTRLHDVFLYDRRPFRNRSGSVFVGAGHDASVFY